MMVNIMSKSSSSAASTKVADDMGCSVYNKAPVGYAIVSVMVVV